jgi:hypothetical protein
MDYTKNEAVGAILPNQLKEAIAEAKDQANSSSYSSGSDDARTQENATPNTMMTEWFK